MLTRTLAAIAAAAVIGLAIIIAVPAAAQNSPCSNGAAVPNPASNPGLVADCEALLAAKDELRGNANLNWHADRNISGWDGVTVQRRAQRVTRLDLPRRGLDGRIPADLGRLSALEHLNLARNQLTGTMPNELGGLESLKAIALSGNSVTGCVPYALRE